MEPASEEKEKMGLAYKDEGNEFFKKKKYPQAIEQYTKAIEADPEKPAYYCNRAFAYLRSEGFGAALNDANAAIQLDNKFVKAYYRRGSANFQLGKFKDARKDFLAVTKVRPNDADAKRKYKECDKLITRLAFEKAIMVEEKQQDPLVDRLEKAINMAKVDANYTGPRTKEDGKIDLDFVVEMIETFKQEGKIHRKYALMILQQAAAIFENMGNLPDFTIAPGGQITVCGDTHGQYFDVLNIFKLNGMPSENNPYLFNGDFVDRGSFSTEVIFTFLALKIVYPDHFHMSRGNHETINMNKMYGFEGEVTAKYTASMNDYFTELYNLLPLGHIIQGKVMIVHGGLFETDGVKLEDIRKLDRRKQPDDGLMCQMLWSDPQHSPGRSPSKRGTGCQFGPDVTKAFLEDNGLELLIRSHEVKDRGYEVMHDGKCITIFSAPNYCDQIGNKGAFITLTEELVPQFTEFDAVPHPDVKCMAYAGGMNSVFGM